jgi:hypothetical protein
VPLPQPPSGNPIGLVAERVVIAALNKLNGGEKQEKFDAAEGYMNSIERATVCFKLPTTAYKIKIK